jgi:hypothetical protein
MVLNKDNLSCHEHENNIESVVNDYQFKIHLYHMKRIK